MEETKKKKGLFYRLAWLLRKCFIIFVPGMVLAVIIFTAINAFLGPTSTVEFCGTLCHEMDSSYESYKKSAHFTNNSGIRVKCTECHLPPRDKYFTHLYERGKTGIKDAYKHAIGAEYNAEKLKKKVASHFENKTCLHCHNNLLENPQNELVASIHKEVLSPPAGKKAEKCIECHVDAGHVKE